MRKISLLTVLLTGALMSNAQPQSPPQKKKRPMFEFNTTNPSVHDPVMAKEGNRYYVLSTGFGIQSISSTDLMSWKMEESPLKTTFPWIQKKLPNFSGHVWAPDIIYYKGKYHLFYCCSAFGKNTSVIGHSVRKTLNPEDESPWADKGMIIESSPMKDNWNAIDPNVIVDEKGAPWLTFGSFWDGIQLVKLSNDMCKTIGTPVTIARRNHSAKELNTEAGANAIEAPFLFYHNGYYYLFVSWDYCCKGNASTYKVAVGRSNNIQGPYTDSKGKDMADGGGTVIISKNDEYNASGHCSVYHLDNKDYFLCHAYSRKNNGMSNIILREIGWSKDGWPIVELNDISKEVIKNKNQLTINLDKHGAEVNPKMHGIFFEEINHSGEGSLYGELLQNRNFEEHVMIPGCIYKDGFAHAPHSLNYGTQKYTDWKIQWNADSLKYVGWKIDGNAEYDIVDSNPLHQSTPNSLKLSLKGNKTKIINSGYWGVAVNEGKNYKLRFYLYPKNYKGKVTAKIVNSNGVILAQEVFDIKKEEKWKEYKSVLTASGTDNKCSFQLEFSKKGDVFVDYVSLFPEETFYGRENGLRKDVAETLSNLKPGFVRWPGGCIVEGVSQKNGFKWKNTIGDPMTRQSEWILWNYHCSWGFGYHEFLQFCEDINSDAMLVMNVGLSCTVRNGDYVANQDSLDYFINDISDAIEYAKGDINTTWGAKRAQSGHPKPFNLKYVEIGNEQIGPIYASIYKKFYKILKEKYPEITFISTLGFDNDNIEKSGKIDMIDPHWYVNPEFFHGNTNLFDTKDRSHFDVYVGEYACIIGSGNMKGALAEAAWISGMERNGDLVKMCSYAPLIENVNRRDWPTNLIWVDNDQVMGRSSYYVQQMYSTNLPTYNVETKLTLPQNESLTDGYIGFCGQELSKKVKDLKVSIKGESVYHNSLAKLKPQNPNSEGMRFMPLPLEIIKEKTFNTGSIEFSICPYPTDSNIEVDINDFRNRMKGITGFIIGSDSEAKNYYQINMDANSNRITISQIVNGASLNLSNNESTFNFDKGKWYKARIDVKEGGNISIYINNDKIMETTLIPYHTIHSIAGYDDKSGETIIKVINGSSKAQQLSISLNCKEVVSKGKVITLRADSDLDENTLKEPNKIAPVTSEYGGFAKEFKYTFNPYSFTILRIKSR